MATSMQLQPETPTRSALHTTRSLRAPSKARWNPRARQRQTDRKMTEQGASDGIDAGLLQAPRRPGRRSAEQSKVQPYAPPRQRKDTGRWVFSYKNPVTGKYVANEALRNPQTGLPVADEAEANAAAQARYNALKTNQKQGQHGLTPVGARDPQLVFPAFVKAARGSSSRPDVEEDNIRLAIADLGNYTEFSDVTDLTALNGPLVARMKLALLTTANLLIENREKARTQAAQARRAQAEGKRRQCDPGAASPGPFRRFTSPENWTRTRLLVLLRLVNFANDLGAGINPDPITKAIGKLGRPRRADDFFYTIDDAAAFERGLMQMVEEGADPYLAMTVWFLLYTGARRSEVRCIRVRDVQLNGTERFPRGSVRIWNSKQNKTRRVNGMPLTREVPLFPRLRRVIESMIRDQQLGPNDFLCLTPDHVKTIGRSVVGDKDLGKLHVAVVRMSQKTLYRFIKEICARAGVEYRSGCHVFRHTYVAVRSRMIHPSGSQVSLSDVQSEIGHVEGSSVTLSIYNKALKSPLPKATASLDWQNLDQQNRRYREEQQGLAIAEATAAEEELRIAIEADTMPTVPLLTSRAVQAMRKAG